MENNKIYNVNQNLWVKESYNISLLCSKNRCLTPMRLKTEVFVNLDGKETMICPKCESEISLNANFETAKKDVYTILSSTRYKDMEIIDIDGISTPVAEDKGKLKNSKYFVTARLMQSKRGLQLAVYAGEKGKNKKKSQIFIEPEIKRLAFDHKDLNPTEIFTELKATFRDGSSQEIRSRKDSANE